MTIGERGCMTMQEIMSGSFGIVITLFFFVMAILIFFMPFFIYGTNKRTKETSQKLDETNKILSDIRATLKSNNQL
jgi:large-conductance mechanosensitive channel